MRRSPEHEVSEAILVPLFISVRDLSWLYAFGASGPFPGDAWGT